MLIQKEQGQVLPLGLALLALTMLGVFVLYNTGQVATDKMKLANTADAAALSGALIQARALNFQAYSNRAMVANQVSIAQAVTLDSWVTYGAVTSENVATVLKPIPVINVLSQGVQTGLQQVEKVISPISQGMLNVVDKVNRGLSIAQEAMFRSAFIATPDVMHQVALETDPRFSVDTAFSTVGLQQNISEWNNFTQGYSAKDVDVMSDRVSMINQSRDTFTRERNWKLFKKFWFYSTPILRHRLYREGTTELIQVENDGKLEWEWKAKDTLSLHNRLWRWRGTKRFELPIGWSETFANSADSLNTIDPSACTSMQKYSDSSECSRLLGMNRVSERLADTGVPSPVSRIKTNNALEGYSGLRPFRSLSEKTLDADFPTLSLKIEVSMPLDQARLSEQTDLGSTFQAPGRALGGIISSISSSEVFYQRPDSHYGELPKANGYSPFWSARLSPVAVEDKVQAASFRSTSLTSPAQLNTGSTLESSAGPRLLSAQSLPIYLEAGVNITVSGDSYSESLINNELNRVLAGSATDVLSGRLADASLSSTEDVTTTQERLTQAIQVSVGDLIGKDASSSYDEAISEAERFASELNDEFARIQTTVSDNFEIAQRQTSLALDAELSDISTEIDRLRHEISNGSHNDDSLREMQQRIDLLQDRAEQLQDGFTDTLARQLMNVVSDATDLYVMRYPEAINTVKEWLKLNLDEVRLPWTELSGDE
ncbi:MAG: pilus assembly protein TadG-related protein [Granulosicoccus sp.]